MKQDERSSHEAIRRSAERMRARRRRPGDSPLRGLSLFGAIGWSVATPTVGGALLGLWLNRVAPAGFSWPVALMLGGLVIGILVAWEWVARESRAAQDESPAQPDKESRDG
ncbi:AtpZ/AtpI family protein [Ottowia sp.]|uniref:AtpZ/AtpI family protein n=1 Tax=Ottowia sp. TaxID=1898956 RepID=UPI002B99924A|nr:AtpZ/AtpI family protein [Ottowia sp.]HRN74287.1 AtpZ/AtpI family protein [Ottowia sp.]HRQ01353.1 AtpZ/AtpI family protein [Ottowia sp.]